MFCEVDGGDSGTLVHLEQRVAAHEVVRGLYILKSFRSSHFLRMENGVAGNERFLVQKFLKLRVKVTVGSPHVGKGSGTTSATRRELMSKEQGVPCSPGIKAGVGVEEGVSLNRSVDPCWICLL